MTEERARYLLSLYLLQNCTPGEQDELFEWISESPADASLKRVLDEVWKDFVPSGSIGNEKAHQMLSHILAHETPAVNKNKKLFSLVWLKWAAASMMLGLVGILSYYQFTPHQKLVVKEVNELKQPADLHDVAPGTTAARLTLADGTSVLLDTVPGAAVASQGNTRIIKQNGRIIYQNSDVNETQGIIYNMLTTDRGHQYPLTLSDGTKVFLNAASSIRFPVMFGEGPRSVEINGEAYFEVAKNGKPFIVNVSGCGIEVLGTHFDVNSYPDEAAVNTTLLEGSVRITHGAAKLLLAPGQQAQVKKDGSITLRRDADTEAAISWTQGYFHFNDASLETVLRQLARWYDVDVVYENHYPEETFGGDIQKSLSLSQVAKILEKSQVKFGIHGKQLIVK